MPFVQQNPRLFTKGNIESLKPSQFGVYGLFRQNRWIYVGKGDIRKRLLDHFNGDNSCINRERPTYWVDELANGNPSEREKALIIELNPVCNLKVG